MNTIKILGCLALIAMAFYVNNVNAKQARQPLDKVIAIVNDEVIAKSELDKYIKIVTSEMMQQPGMALPSKGELERQILNHLILEKIQLQMARTYGIDMDSFAVTQAMQEMCRQQNITIDEMKHEIESRGIDFNEFRDLIRTQMIIQNLHVREIGQEITVAKHEVESFLNSTAGQDHSGIEYQLGHILLSLPDAPTPDVIKKIQTEADKLVAELRAGADFGKTAIAKSSGRQALSGGDLGWRTTAELPTIFVNYVPALEIGEVANPIRSAGGVHIIKLLNKRTNSQPSKAELHVRQIVITPSNTLSSEEAKELISAYAKQIKSSEDFAKIAEKYSHDKRTANKGGDLGWVTAEVVPEKFAEVMQKLRNGEVSEPFLTDEGWTLVQVVDKRMQRTSDEAAWHKAMEILTMRKQNEVLEAWTKRIRDEAQVKILLPEA